MCPICNKQCDEIHDPYEKTKHNFFKDSSHQFLGFGGNKASFSNKAITFSCNDFKDDDFVKFRNN